MNKMFLSFFPEIIDEAYWESTARVLVYGTISGRVLCSNMFDAIGTHWVCFDGITRPR